MLAPTTSHETNSNVGAIIDRPEWQILAGLSTTLPFCMFLPKIGYDLPVDCFLFLYSIALKNRLFYGMI